MARLFATGINLNKNELINARIHNYASDPLSPVAGQIYFNTIDNVLKFYDGTQWIAGGSVEFGTTGNRPAASKSGTLYVDTDTKVLYVDNGTSWIQGTLSESDVQGWISDHNNLTTGVHGVTGNVVGTSDTQTLSNKTISDSLKFNTGSNDSTIYAYGNDLTVYANNDLFLNTDSGNIVLQPDGHAYIGSAGANNRIVTVSDLESNTVVQSVSGTANEVEVTDDGNANLTVGLPDDVNITTSLGVGQQTGPYSTFEVSGTGESVTVNGTLNLKDANSANGSSIYTDVNNDLQISAYNNLVLNPDGSAYVGSTSQTNKIVTEGGSATLTNKNIGDELTFTNPSTYAVDGGLVINDGNEHFEIKAYTSDLDITSTNGDITLNPDGQVVVNSNLDVDGNIFTPQIYGRGGNGGNLILSDSHNQSQIHIDDTSKHIELSPYGSGKAFYGSSATAGNEIAKISDLQALSSGLTWKQAVHVLSIDNVSLSGSTPLVIDTHTLSDGYRVLLLGQSTATENGIYDLAIASGSYTLTRSADADNDDELKGAAVFVMEGNTYANTSWVQNYHYVASFADQDWVQFSGQGTYIGSNSIYLDGTSFSVIADSTRGLATDVDGVFVKTANGIHFDGNGDLEIYAGTGFDISSGLLEFASGYGVRKHSESIGDGVETSWVVTHGFNTRDITVQVFDNSSPYAQVEADVEHTNSGDVTIKFASAPTTDQYRVVVIG